MQTELLQEIGSKRDPMMEKEVRRQQAGKVGCFSRVSVVPATALEGNSSQKFSPLRRLWPPPSHLHHQHNGVQGDHGHDGVLEGWRHHEVPDAVLEGVPVLRHVAGEGLGADGEVDARPLWEYMPSVGH